MRILCLFLLAASALVGAVSPLSAGIVNYTDKDAWFAAAGSVTAITFAEFPTQIITTQYADLGVTFPEGEINFQSWSAFPTDGWGLKSLQAMGNPITIDFDAPRHAVGVEYPGGTYFRLFLGGVFVGESWSFSEAIFGPFAGVTSGIAFDRVEIISIQTGLAFIDNLYFGPAIPAPVSIGLFLAIPLAVRSRRRRA